ncbi:MAG: cell shape determination protein CcmA [Bacteroidetes bacterium HGW-Bacteroidetes-6]|jgi:cytoskeletal protein CcmA (bactofilin family)|nr:MAG: cell shape determination protein CcmA [Bacteroidetes bacterium HGW-Bacteroidetes-6]
MAKTITPEPQTPNINLIGAGTVIVGDVKANGDIRVDGTINGKLHGKGKVVVGTSGSIEGEINCQNADISGMVKGQIHVTELLVIKTSAKIIGDIHTQKISIEPGALFTGNCSMSASVNKEVISSYNAEAIKRPQEAGR